MYDTQAIAARIKSCAKSQKIAMKTLLNDCDMNINAISEFSKGKQMSCINLARIADYLDVSVDYLLGRTVSPSELSPEALELASRWDKLNDDGKALVRAELVHAENRTDVPNL